MRTSDQLTCPFCSYAVGVPGHVKYLGDHIEAQHQRELRFLYGHCEKCFYAIYCEGDEGVFRWLPLPYGPLQVISSELTDHLAACGGGLQHLLELSLEPTR